MAEGTIVRGLLMRFFNSIVDRVQNFMEGGVDEDDYDGEYYEDYDDDDDDEAYYEEPPVPVRRERPERPERQERPERNLRAQSGGRASGGRAGGNVIDFDSRKDEDGKVKIMVIAPKEMEQATLICDHIREGKICIVNMKGADPKTGQRIADYLGGVTYALYGQVERVDNQIFIMAPPSTIIAADLMDELKTGGLFRALGGR